VHKWNRRNPNLPLLSVKGAGQQTHIIVSGRDEVVAVRSVQLLRPRVSGVAQCCVIFSDG
jgi:hypothetical protein